MNTIDIDVDSRLLVCKIRRQDQPDASRQFPNSPAGFRQFIRWATGNQQPARVCMEATGVYSIGIVLALHNCEQIEVMVFKPKAMRHFATARLTRGKTDLMDAAVILEYLQRMEVRPWQPPSRAIMEIQHSCRHIAQLQREHTREENRRQVAL